MLPPSSPRLGLLQLGLTRKKWMAGYALKVWPSSGSSNSNTDSDSCFLSLCVCFLWQIEKFVMKYFFSRGWKETGRVNLQSRTNKPRSTLVFTNLSSIISDFFGWCIFRLVLFCMKAGVMALDYGSWWKWTWSSRLYEQPKQLEKNPKKIQAWARERSC